MIWASACSLGKLRSTIRLCGSSSGVSAAYVPVTGAENITAIAAENTKARTRASTEMSLAPGRFQMILSLQTDLNCSPSDYSLLVFLPEFMASQLTEPRWRIEHRHCP